MDSIIIRILLKIQNYIPFSGLLYIIGSKHPGINLKGFFLFQQNFLRNQTDVQKNPHLSSDADKKLGGSR
jgi:hypothetical protein